ncbi:hypothetical protein DCO48_11720 [Pseudomonas sp. SDI]|uniref:hypothetical protein n=1 Tax=Pseudomonas sp. SDI TaxID=2170734 RepID=UPI000DE798CF|nr:hypothetical protein [Pseudomonas sp. SDI]PWB33056.1 hypothetical protein DCO48_11720 [Pseudomonas sp. SDI]
MSMDTTSQAVPAAPPTDKSAPAFFVVSLKKLIVMHLCTAGLYGVYWYYKNWALYKQASGQAIRPRLRTIFGVLLLYPLLSRVHLRIRASERYHPFSPLGITLAAIIPLILGIATSSWLLSAPLLWGVTSVVLSAVQYVALVKAQIAINFCEGDEEGKGNADFTPENGLWMLGGGFLYFILFKPLLS